MYQPRIYVHGNPNNGKTLAIVKTAKRPIAIINCPGETGYATIPDGDPDLVRWPSFDPTQNSTKILLEVQAALTDLIKAGKYQTIAIEGIHGLAAYVMDHLSQGTYFKGVKPDWNLYDGCYHWLDHFISKAIVNNVHQVIFTGWSKEKGERKPIKGEKPEDVPQLIGPDMFGKYSSTILGRIPFVFHQTLRPLKDAKGAPVLDKEGKGVYGSYWQTRPYGKVKGVGMKGPANIITAMPLHIPADYTNLERLWHEYEKLPKVFAPLIPPGLGDFLTPPKQEN